jgi:hypothetical protein
MNFKTAPDPLTVTRIIKLNLFILEKEEYFLDRIL